MSKASDKIAIRKRNHSKFMNASASDFEIGHICEN
jgi:hypothetical protein